MRFKPTYLLFVIVLALPLFLSRMPQVVVAQSATPTPTASVGASGPAAIVGEAGSANFYASPDTYSEPVVALLDVSNVIKAKPVFAGVKGQILGAFDTGMFPLPAKFSINLPIRPTGASLDLDNNGKADAGVQVFAVIAANNFTGDSYLQQLDQSGMASYLTDLVTGAVTEGAFLVYAPDAKQGFPTGYGADKKWFTNDDPAALLPQGYSVARLSADGKVTWDRSAEPVINTVERKEVASPDFSKQGILESYNSLIDTLKKRYAYTDLRKLDWEKIRAKYLPAVQKADAAKDSAAYFVALNTLAHSLRDAHVAAIPGTNVEAVLADIKARNALVSGNLGADTITASDPANPKAGPTAKTVVRFVEKDTPAAKAGWAPGAEIVSIDGKPVADRYDSLPLIKSVGTEEGVRAQLAPFILRFPVSQTVTIGYRLPDSAKVMTATMTAGDYTWDAPTPPAAEPTTPISYRQVGDTAVLKWNNFVDNMQVKIAVLEEALGRVKGASKPGVILDLRGNGGGAAGLYMTMASYFFKPDKPMPSALFDWYKYDAKVGGLIKTYSPNYLLSAPKPELAYTGPLVILVDQNCASSCEYFSQHLQKLGRATVVGQYSTEGAGGPVDRIQMPGGLTFQYTMGQTTFAGTKEFNLEAKGVVPDIRVSVTLETEAAKLKGEDPVMQAAVAESDRQVAERAGRLSAQPWQWVSFKGPKDEFKVETPKDYVLTFSKPEERKAEIKTDCATVVGMYSATLDQLALQLESPKQGACRANSRGERLLKLLTGAALTASYTVEDGNLQIVLSDGSTLAFTAQELKNAASGGARVEPSGQKEGPGRPLAAPPPAAQIQPPFVSINLDAGIPLDPFFISLQGGGPVDASRLDKSCSGWLPAAPSVVFELKGKAPPERLKFFMYSDHDPTLVVKTPDGKFVCNDNTNPLLLDPTVTIEQPKPGAYSVWAGNRAQRGLVAGLLVATAKPGVDLGTFRPGELVKRPSIPETLVAPRQDPGNAERLRQAMAEIAATAPRVKPGDPDTTVAFVADGRFSPITYLHDDLRCNGLIKLEATYVFSLTETIPNLRIFAEGNHDSNLIVKTPTAEPQYACSDDATGENYNPMVDIANPAAGLYAVWVGRVNADEPVAGNLTITQSSRQPKALKDR